METVRVYLAGSLSCPERDTWRKKFIELSGEVSEYKVKCFNPIDRPLDAPAEFIFSWDLWGVKNANIVVVYADTTKVTTGTAQEVAFAKSFGAATILIAPSTSILRKASGEIEHPFLVYSFDAIVSSVEEAVEEVMRGIHAKANNLETLLQERLSFFENTLLPKDSQAQEYLSD